MDTLVLIARGFEVNKSTVEDWKQFVDEALDHVIERGIALGMNIIDVAVYSGANDFKSVPEDPCKKTRLTEIVLAHRPRKRRHMGATESVVTMLCRYDTWQILPVYNLLLAAF